MKESLGDPKFTLMMCEFLPVVEDTTIENRYMGGRTPDDLDPVR